ncbi:metal ABC transporter permease [Devosia salina]|uniref:Metal ABC transporter permease n=1 Tax=Devosia salina TaxID=2860336 RepID=A0ABX8WDR7_9HYPH|nr:metal ABC transporter permease [Devosia salina]QYO77050.1 metal ABC transporter permease [Devosia salina]
MTDLIDLMLLPFQFPFMVQAMVIGVLVAVPTALLSCFLVLKGWSLMGDAISHAVLPGVVLAYLAGLPLGLGAFIAGMVCALSVGFLKENSRIKEDTVMGVVFAGLFGLGIVLYTAITTDVHLDHILFGNMLGVDQGDILLAVAIGLLVTGVVAAKWRDLMLFIFDPQQAGAIGLPVRWLHYGLLAMISLTIVGALQAVGIVLVIALLIAPGAIAFLITRRFGIMLIVAMAVSVSCSLIGVYVSFFLDSAPAPTIVLLMSASFVVTFIATQRRSVAVV